MISRRRFLKSGSLFLPALGLAKAGALPQFGNPALTELLDPGGAAVVTLKTNLAGYWKMDEGAVGTAIDSYGSNNLTDNLNNVASRSPGQINTGRGYFASPLGPGGTTLLKSSSSIFTMGAGKSFTCTAWIYWGSLNVSSVINKWDGSTQNEWLVLLGTTSGNWFYQLYATTIGGVQKTFNSGTLVGLSAWLFLAVGYDAVAQSLWMIDGASGGHVRARQSISCDSVKSGTALFMLGNSPWTAPAACAFDEVAFWTRSLSDSEVDQIYNGGAGLPLSSF